MSGAGRRLRLLVPHLLGPLPRGAVAALPRLPALETLFAKGRREAIAGGVPAAQLQAQFDPARGELPAGAVGLLGEGEEPGDAYWFCADPVHLRPDRERIMLFSGLSLEAAETARLLAEFNRFFADDGVELRAPEPTRWYLRVERPPRMETTPTAAVSGRYYDPFLPTGPDALSWLRLHNEMQMLLHGSSVNLEREARGQVAVNGLWVWGGGRLPAPSAGPWDSVAGDDPLLRGWARLSGAGVQPPNLTSLEPAAATLVLDQRLERALLGHDLSAWEQGVQELEVEWLEPLLARLRGGALDSLELAADGALWRLQRRDLRRFWRRLRPWQDYLHEST